MQPKVSVLICTYNAEQYIQATLQSVLKQTFLNFEILILDNNSSDRTLDILEKVSDSRVQIFPSKKNLGPYWGLNFLLEKATGEYIAIQDHDDLWHSEKIAKQVAILEENKKYIWCGTKTLMRYEGDQKWFEYYLGKETYYTLHPSLMFRNIPGLRYPDTVYMADALFQKKMLCHGKKVLYNINETLTLHRVRDWAHNYSYKWYKFTWKNLQTVFGLHPLWYAVFATLFELVRKIVYPVLHWLKLGRWIDVIERVPFVLQGYTVKKYSDVVLNKMGFMM